MKKQIGFKTKGMNRDLSVSAYNPEFAFENMNLRLSTNEGNTLLSWVNEKGTSPITIYKENEDGTVDTGTIFAFSGTPIGTAVINDYLILFVKGSIHDFICRLKYTDGTKTALQCKVLCEGSLNFDANHPLETRVSYESELVQKVYWVDGINQPRSINICKSYGVINTSYNPFDFIQTMKLKETVHVKKQLGGGMFAPGVIQYAFTYYNRYSAETNIFYTTPLQYISYKERGASPEDKVENAFKITVKNVDSNFEYLRIYSIQRTSINATPICKRIQDIEISGLTGGIASYTDTGTSGDAVDPTELLFKGGDPIIADTLEQKDNTLFLGGIANKRKAITDNMVIGDDSVNLKSLIEHVSVSCSTRSITPISVSSEPYQYANQLTSEETINGIVTNVPCSGFKTGNYYRLGVQFQHESGKWSDPIFINNKSDILQVNIPSVSGSSVVLPAFESTLNSGMIVNPLVELGYKRARGCMVIPRLIDKDIVCQGVTCPTLYTKSQRTDDKSLYAQSSWFFRPYMSNEDPQTASQTTLSPKSRNVLEYTRRNIEDNFPDTGGFLVLGAFNPDYIRQVEIEGDYIATNRFQIDTKFRTLHSPDIEFDEQLWLYDFSGCSYGQAGAATFAYTLSDIDIQTETPTASNNAGGFVHKSFNSTGAKGIVSGLFYEDYVVDDDIYDTGQMGGYPKMLQSPKWLVYPWQGTGSLNNDINRPADKGLASAILKKKVISNLRYANISMKGWNDRKDSFMSFASNNSPQIFQGEQDSILKMNDNIYKGNIDTSLVPDNPDGVYFCFDGYSVGEDMWGRNTFSFKDVKTPFDSTSWLKTFSRDANQPNQHGLRYWSQRQNKWLWWGGDGEREDIGETYVDLVIKKLPVRMKYKSTPHLIFNQDTQYQQLAENDNQLAVVEIKKPTTDDTRYGGKSMDALKENVWVPCGEPVDLIKDSNTTIKFRYGDTYFQRYDCLKTYPFTREDLNQIVEIGSFMLESYVNIDGRYDRNRGQSNNLNMSPQNFNLMNLVYSQTDNFFSYRIQDNSYYENTKYPNQITWSKTKNNGSDVDLWTNITLASILELDGDKGEISKLIRFGNYLYAFQETGISQILYNDNVQIQSTNGVPIEIANSGKVLGKDYKSNTIGCSNKWSITSTPNGIYFIDSNDKSIYRFGEGLTNVSQQGGFNTWTKQNVPAGNIDWTPQFPEDYNGSAPFISCYDKLNQDVLFINNKAALAFSEKLGVFTSFYNYEGCPFFENLEDSGIWIRQDGNQVQLWKHQAGNYCTFFGVPKPYWMTLVGNPEPQMDKTFTNLEFRAIVEGDGVLLENGIADTFDTTFDSTFHISEDAAYRFNFYLPFDSLEVWDEYQHGYTTLETKNGHSAIIHGDDSSALKRKFRIWRCDIPRNNTLLDKDRPEPDELPYSTDAELSVSRHIRKPLDRMRNPWLYIKLLKQPVGEIHKTEIHDLVMTYYT